MKSEANEPDSLKKQSAKGFINSGNNLELLGLLKIHDPALRICKEELSLQNSLASGIQPIKGFNAFNRPARPSPILSLVSGLDIAVTILLIFVKATRTYLKSIGNS